MDKKTIVSKITGHVKTGEFSKALNLLKDTKLVKERAINLFIAASNACYHNAEKCEIELIEKLCNVVIVNIESIVDPQQLNVYVQSIYHIVKLLCKEEMFEDILKMETIINPTFFKPDCLKNAPEAQRNYSLLILLISQSISQLAHTQNKSHNKHLLKLFKLIFKAYNHLNNIKDFLTLAHKLYYQFLELGATNDELLSFYIILLETLSSKIKSSSTFVEADLESTLLLLVPIFSDIFSSVIQKGNFEFATTFLDVVQCRARVFFSQHVVVNCHLMFEPISSLFPSNKDHLLENIHRSEELIKEFKTSNEKLFYKVIFHLEGPLWHVLSHYKNADSQAWCQLSDIIVVVKLQFFMNEFLNYSMHSPNCCSCGCNVNKNYSGTLKIGCQMVSLLKMYLASTSRTFSHGIYIHLIRWLEFCYAIIKKQKEHSCNRWKSYYNNLSAHCYNIAIVLYQAHNVNYKEVIICFLKNSLELDGLLPTIRPLETHIFSFNCLCELEFKNENWIEAMGLVALYTLLHGGDKKIFNTWWIRCKSTNKQNEDIQQLTTVGVLYKQIKQLSRIYDFESLLTTKKKTDLIAFELSCYIDVWKSKVPIMTSFTHLIEIADILQIAGVIIDVFGEGDKPLHHNMLSVFTKLRKSMQIYLQNYESNCVKLALAVLHFYHFKMASREMADKNLKEMERTMQVLDTARKGEVIEAVPKDANEECDIVTAYSNLRLSKFIDLLAYLDTCKALLSSVNPDSCQKSFCKTIFKLLISIGFEYRLHFISIKSINAFCLAMKYAEKSSDDEGTLTALSHIIESANVRQNFVKDLIQKGDGIVKKIEQNCLTEKYTRLLVTYYICKCKALLLEDEKQSYEAWQQANALSTHSMYKNEIQMLCSQLHVLLYKLTRNCNFIKDEHTRSPMTSKLHAAFDIVVDVCHKTVVSTYELCILFDTCFELAKAYSTMRLPRDLRAYSKNSVLLTQKIVLPLRCVSFLLLLAHSDIVTSKFDHCTDKLSGIDDILCITHKPTLAVTNDTPPKCEENDLDRCTELIEELVLDLPQHTRQFSPASPTLTVEGFKKPPFLSHNESCLCFMCLSWEFQFLLLEKYYINALINMYEKQDKVAEEFALGALSLHKIISENFEGFKRKVSTLIAESLVPNFDDMFAEPYAKILFEYSFHLNRQLQSTKAMKFNTMLVQYLRPKKLQFPYLYRDALLQRFCYIVPKSPPEPSKNVVEIPSSIQNVVQTPANKVTAVKVMVNGKPQYTPHNRKVKKCNLFANIEDSDIETPAKTQSEAIFALPKPKSKSVVATTPATPFLGSIETPKIKVFNDDSPSSVKIRTYSRKKSVKKPQGGDHQSNNLVETKSTRSISSGVPVLSAASRTRNKLSQESSAEVTTKASASRLRKNVVGDLLATKIVPKSKENIPTEICESSSLLLESPEQAEAATKTKFLMEKMKTSIKKSDQTKVQKPKRSAVGSEVKKNLLSEFEDNVSSNSTGAIRKSTRNKRIL